MDEQFPMQHSGSFDNTYTNAYGVSETQHQSHALFQHGWFTYIGPVLAKIVALFTSLLSFKSTMVHSLLTSTNIWP